jgi:hypothetical protein
MPKNLGLVGHSLIFFVLTLMAFLGNVSTAYAGFGITPPYVNNDRLTRGTVYEQRITLVRSDPDQDLKTTITLNVPGAQDWISIDKGLEFIMPAGQMQVPIVVKVKVPANAEYQAYKGAIRVRTAASDDAPAGGVAIALGAQIDVNLKVVDKIYDFNVRRIRLADLETGRTKWGLYFPGKIRFFMTVENTGNTQYGPSRVHFDIYDANGEDLLESVDNLNSIERIAPFSTKEVVAELPTRLGPGLYTVKYTIYKDEDISQQGQLHLNIAAVGGVPGYEGYGFDGLSKVVVVLGLPFSLLIFFIYLIALRRRKRRR